MRIFWDSKIRSEKVVIGPGEFHTAASPRIISTVLGSCVSVCLKDRTNDLAGMNHFMLPEAVSDETMFCSDAARYGMHAMELLITELQQRGGRKENLRAKVFGGGQIIKFGGPTAHIPASNINFALAYLETEGIPVIAKDVGGRWARRIEFYTAINRIVLRRFTRETTSVQTRDHSYRGRMVRDTDNRFVLFDRRLSP